ncbi:helix-turn-helix domain-containing protein [Leucobacter viscericola]|uniref:Helix-turn-helix domain-containing protein n=1 Tax=Leucobacter viscericola TaxID=2714935 RepID=A0A6G7XEE2_9MICO|nr:helix-turn-helix domain-containing protein [Leucobacter viscericola]QIK62741.1 helix-turn-helix domain-containing protein [Leucobacter viscericola]
MPEENEVASVASATAHGPQSVHRALEILTLVAEREPIGLSDLARASQLPASTAMRMLRALEQWSYVWRTDDGRYALGSRFIDSRVPAVTSRDSNLLDLSGPVMAKLTEETLESSYLAIPTPSNTCTFLREVQSPLPIRHVGFDGWVGRTASLDRSAAGEVFAERTPETGYVVREAVDDPDATVVAAPVFGEGGTIIAALSVAGPTFRMSPERVELAGRAVTRAADALAALVSA